MPSSESLRIGTVRMPHIHDPRTRRQHLTPDGFGHGLVLIGRDPIQPALFGADSPECHRFRRVR